MARHFTEEYIIKRSEWGAKESTHPLPELQHPIVDVIVTYTGTNVCTTQEECKQMARDLQAEYQKHKIPDIAPNFMIGGDGYVYEGRGWNYAPLQHPCAPPQLEGKSLEISYFGTKGDFPEKWRAFLAWDLVLFGTKLKYLEKNILVKAYLSERAEDQIIYTKKSKTKSARTKKTEE